MDHFDLVKDYIESFGWSVLDKPNKNDNCCDLTAVSGKKSLRIEIKKCRQLPSGSWQAQPLSEDQLKYDAVAVVLPNEKIHIEAMENYLRLCTKKRYRTFTFLKPGAGIDD